MDNEFPTQDDLASIMEQLGFTSQEIAANRQFNGQLFLSEDALEAFTCSPLMPGETVCSITGELLHSKVWRNLVSLQDQINELIDRAEVAFQHRRSDPTEREAMMDFISFMKDKAEVARLLMAGPVDKDRF
jgi:hypothetical protein